MLSRSVMPDVATPWTVAHQAPLSKGFPRQDYWSGLPFPPPGDISDPGISSLSPALAGRFVTTQPPRKSILIIAAIAAKSLQSCPTLCDPRDGSPPGSTVPGILQARILEWDTISFSRGSSQPRDQNQVSHIAGRCFNL